jgi:GNAT superfamily N-acetyltransferase
VCGVNRKTKQGLEDTATTYGAEAFTPEYLDDSQEMPKPVEIGLARTTDGLGITRAHVLGSRSALDDIPKVASADVERFISTVLGPGYLTVWTMLASGNEPGLFVARTTDCQIAGFIWVSHRLDGTGELKAWYVHPKWHNQGVGRRLMFAGLRHLGNIDVYTGTHQGSSAERIYRHYGFVDDVSAPESARTTPPPMMAHNIAAPQVPLVLRRGIRDVL